MNKPSYSRIHREEAKEAFDEALVHFEKSSQYGANEAKSYLTQFRARLIDQLAISFYFLNESPPKGETLSIGGWPGISARIMAQKGFNVTAIDHPSLMDGAAGQFHESQGINAISYDFANASESDIPMGRFHFIECCQCIEHWNFNPLPAITKLLRDHLHEKGKLLITVPNGVSLHRRLSVLAGQNPFAGMHYFIHQMEDDSNADVSPHWREYSAKDLMALADACNGNIEFLWAKTYARSNLLSPVARALYLFPQLFIPSIRENLCLVLSK